VDRCWETFDALIKAGASIHSRGGLFGTALKAAAYVGDERYVETLLLAGADVQTREGFIVVVSRQSPLAKPMNGGQV
jgi:hypothetical protein